MAATINVDLAVDDAKFIAFFRAFESFSKSADGSATKWGKINSEMGAAASQSRELIDQSSEAADNIERARQAVAGLKPMTETISRGWNALAISTGKISANLKEATLALLRWSGITGLVAGAGTWGMGALGQSVTSDRAAALGAGTTYGGRQAFGIAFSRFGGADTVLSKVAAIQASSDHTALKALGLSDEEIRNLDPAELAARAYQALGRGARAQPKDRLGDWMRSRRIDEVFDLGQARQAGQATGTGEMNDLIKSFHTNRERLNISEPAQSAWVKFNMQLEISTAVLKNTFASAIAKLAPGLTAIMNSFTSLVDKLLKDDGPFGQVLDDFNKWLDKTLKTLDDKKVREWFNLFMNSVKTLVSVTWDLVKGLASLLRFFGVTPAEAATAGQQGANGGIGRAEDGSGHRRAAVGRRGGAGSGDLDRLPANYPASEGRGNLTALIHEAAGDSRVEAIMEGIRAGESLHTNRYDVKDDAIESSWGPFQLNRRRGLGVEF